jgi:hypothetical protein
MWSSLSIGYDRTSTCHYHIFMYLYIVLNIISYTSSYYLKARCSTNTGNRGKVKYLQRTGSQSYIVQANLVVSR